MKCKECGAEMREVREEHCKDASENPMYMDYAYCDQCGNKVQISKNAYRDGEISGAMNSSLSAKRKTPLWAKVLAGIGLFFAICIVIGMIQGIHDVATGKIDLNDTESVAEATKNPQSTKEAEETEEPESTPEVTEEPKPTEEPTPTPEPTLSPAQKKKIEKQKAKKAKAKAKKEKKNFIAKCKSYPYKKVLRNPSKYYGKKIKIKCQVNQIVDGGLFSEGFMRCYTYSGYDIYAEDEYVVLDKRDNKDPKLLQNDVITVYGTISYPREVTRALTGTSDEVFAIDMKYVKIHN